MNEETNGLNIILISILCAILYFTYCAMPSNTHVKKTDKKSRQRNTIADTTQSDHDNKIVQPSRQEVKQTLQTSTSALTEETIQTPIEDKAKDAVKGNSTDISVILMNNPKYKTHKKPIVAFTHEKHVKDYKIDCGSCHHDENGKPLTLTYEDSVQSCILCHPGTEKIKGEKLSKKDKIMKYHSEALHANCIGCHKTFNIENGDPKGKQPAPTSCNTCHPKN